MAVNSTRSPKASLLEGATDGIYRKARPNTTSVPSNLNEAATADARAMLHPYMNYGYVNATLPPEQMQNPGA